MTLTSRFHLALSYASLLHADQTRKGEDKETPYIAHLLGVCGLVLEVGGDEDQAVAALLHDAAEDQGGQEQLDEIERRFGPNVAEIVRHCTDTMEQPKPDWLPRKKAYVASLPDKPERSLLVSAADKLHNARAILRDHRQMGDRIFERFTGGKDGTMWYYRALVDAFREAGLEGHLVEELDRVVTELEERTAR